MKGGVAERAKPSVSGHDIGAAIAWQTALLRPDRFRAIIALSPPFRSRGFATRGHRRRFMPRTENAVFYQLLQNPAAEAGLGRDLRLTFRYQFYALSGDSPPSEGIGRTTARDDAPEGQFHETDPPVLARLGSRSPTSMFT